MYCAFREAYKFGSEIQKWNKNWRKIGANLGMNLLLCHMVEMETADN